MLEESLPSIWASMNGWFSRAVLFVLLNLMIGTIVVSSRIGAQKQKHQENQGEKQEQKPQIDRSPSVLQRLKSINLYRNRSEEVNPFPVLTTTLQPPDTETVQTLDEPQGETLDQMFQSIDRFEDHHVTRTKSESKPTSGEMPEKLPKKLKKSASSSSAFRHFEEEEIIERQRPSTVKEAKSKASDLQSFGDDDEVDAKADDFINKFKEQLKLQRLDSILQYKEMLSKGAQ